MDTVLHYLGLVSYVVAGAAALAKGLATMTSNKADDKVAGWLEWLHDVLAKLGLQSSLEDKRTVYRAKLPSVTPNSLPSDPGGGGRDK